MYMAAVVAQSVRAFAPQVEGWMFEYYSRDRPKALKYVVAASLLNVP